MPTHAVLSSALQAAKLPFGRSFATALSFPITLHRLSCSATGLRAEHVFIRALMIFFLLSAAALFYCSAATAAQVTLAWDPVQPAPDGYRLYNRTETGTYNYTRPAWSGTATTCTINNLAQNTAYKFVVRAYVGSNQSGNSNEISFVPPTQTNQPPVANAGSDQTVAPRATVTLNGSGSDPEGQTLRYQWRQTGGTTVQLSNATAARPTFTAPAVTSGSTTLTFSLTVTDSQNASASDSSQVVVTSSATNQPPVAEAGSNQIVASRSLVTLNGSSTSDPEKQPLTYRWVQKSGPAVTLQNANTARPTFRAPVVTSYVLTLSFELRVTDPQGLSTADTCQVMVSKRRTDKTSDTPTVSEAIASGPNLPPSQPVLSFPQPEMIDVADAPELRASEFEDPDADDQHLLSQWQIRRRDDQLLVMDLTCEMEPLNRLQVPPLILEPDTEYTYRVRYYDARAEASPWSPEVAFTTLPAESDLNGNGIPDGQEADPRADLNADGIPDNEQPTVIKTMRTSGGRHQLGVSIETSQTALAIERAALLDVQNLPDALTADQLPYGLLACKIEVEEPGSETVVRFLYSDPLPADARWVRHDAIWGWHDCASQSAGTEGDQVIERQLTDGGPDDADGAANGIIVDLAGPRSSVDSSLGGDAPSDSGGGGGGGCFIESLRFNRP